MAETLPIQPPVNHPDDLIEAKNITNVDFTFYWDSVPREVKAYQKVIFQRYMAVQFARKLIVFIINSKNYKVREGDTVRDAFTTNDQRFWEKFAPLILLRVVSRHIPQEEPKKVKMAKSKFELNEYEIPQQQTAPEVKIELPPDYKEQEIFGDIETEQPVQVEEPADPPAGSGEPPEPKVEVEEEPKAPGGPQALIKPKVEVEGNDDPKSSQGAKGDEEERSTQDLQNECRAMGIEISGSESKAQLKELILASSR